LTCTQALPQRLVWGGQPQRRGPCLWAGGRQISPGGQHLPLQWTRCFGQRPVAAAHASAGVIIAALIAIAPPVRSASRRDMPPARPRAIMSIALSELRSADHQPNLGIRQMHRGPARLAEAFIVMIGDVSASGWWLSAKRPVARDQDQSLALDP